MKRIALIPIDDRPVCYNLPLETAKIDDDFELLLPPRNMLGNLTKTAEVNSIIDWFQSLNNLDAVVISLDTIAYGGLIPSRRTSEPLEKIQAQLEKFKDILSSKKTKIYAFSSIMRISNNNINEEEKPYWSDYGKEIFKYSYNLHKFGLTEGDIPPQILEDYLISRSRNYEINKMYLNWLQEGVFSTLVFSKDDCAPFGLNVMEAKELERINNEKNLSALIKTGADEIPLTLLARAVSEINRAPKISAEFLAPECTNLISNYEDISIFECVKAQIELAGGIYVENKNYADIVLVVNNFENIQGEIVMNVETKPFLKGIELPQKPYLLADVRFANGADNCFVEKIIDNISLDNFYGYSGWNTSANTLGSLLFAGTTRFFAKKYSKKAFIQMQLTRFLDDWAYQANVRQQLKKQGCLPDGVKAKELMKPYEEKLEEVFGVDIQAQYSFPWNRFFEIEVKK